MPSGGSSPDGGANHSNSSEARNNRVVELLPDNNNHNNNDSSTDWVLRPEFYNEDVALNQDNISADDELSIHSNDAGSDLDDYEDLGYIPRDGQTSSDDSEQSDQDEEVDYDISLPVNHSYLGDNLEESRGRQVLSEGSVVSLPLFNLDIVLFPGQSMPIATSNLNPRIELYLKECLDRGLRIIGIIYRPRENTIGTTAEIRNYSVGQSELKLILEGSQRFKLRADPFETAVMGQVEILPEIVLGPPNPRISNFLTKMNLSKSPTLASARSAKSGCHSTISRFPAWVHRLYDARYLTLRILNQIEDWCSTSELASREPNDFSYWMSSMLPISNRERCLALELGCAEARLLWLVDLLEKCTQLVCCQCSNIICYKKDIFSMSRSGPQCSFVNPGGYIHDTLTVKDAQGLLQDASWVEEFSWFPGYKWRLAHCSHCGRHIGWCYKRTDAKTRPKRFFGLSRTNLNLKRPPSCNSQQETNPAAGMHFRLLRFFDAYEEPE